MARGRLEGTIAPPWYVAEGERAQELLDQGQVEPAAEIFETILARIGEAPSYGRALILERLGRCHHLAGRIEQAMTHLRQAITVTGRLAPSPGVKALRGTLRSELGDALRAAGRPDEARKAYEAALKIARELQDPRREAVDLGRLGALALNQGNLDEAMAHYAAVLGLVQRLAEPALEAVAREQLGVIHQQAGQADEAERHYREAARLSEARGDAAGAAQSWGRLARLSEEAGDPEAAERWSRRAVDAERQAGRPLPLARRLSALAALLRHWPDRLAEARWLADEALATAQAVDPLGPEVWSGYGLLADLLEREASAADPRPSAALRARSLDFRELHNRGPLIVAALLRLDEVPTAGRAVILGRLGRCLHRGGRPDLAVTRLREAVTIATRVVASGDLPSISSALHADLGDALRSLGLGDEARHSYLAALRISEESQDYHGQAADQLRLAALAATEGELEEASERAGSAWDLARRIRAPTLQSEIRHLLSSLPPRGEPREEADPAASTTLGITLFEELTAEFVFEPDLLLDVRPAVKILPWAGMLASLPDAARPMLGPGARTWLNEDGSVRFSLPADEPRPERQRGCVVIRRSRRELAVSENTGLVWRLVREVDGMATIAEILAAVPVGERPQATRLLSGLAAAGAFDVSGRAVARFVHRATKKGVLPAGGLTGEDVLRLATDGNYREHPGTGRIALGRPVPDRLRPLHALTRARRSRRDYGSRAVSRDDFEALLHTACGVTGAMPWAGREVKLRAYPSSGALYAVEIYPVVLRVDDLEPAVYHYLAAEHLLEVVRPGIDRAGVVAAALPVEREMVAGAAALICLTGVFPRHERKYGEGGYRMLVAEAGHLSQNLVLAATALGLSARPFGGVFDELLNHDLALDPEQEQFLLGVLVGHAGAPEEGTSQ